jgi:SMI1-KNR4 cell-wall
MSPHMLSLRHARISWLKNTLARIGEPHMPHCDSVLSDAVGLILATEDNSGLTRCPVSDVEIDAVERELRIGLPASYRQFLKLCGAGRVGTVDVFGLPRNHLWGDIVLMNELVDADKPPGCIKFASDWTGRAYYFDTSRTAADADWPVVVMESSREPRLVARNFLEFVGKLVQPPITVELKGKAKTKYSFTR